MNKTFKKALAVLLAVFMVAGFVPFVDIAPTTASAAVSTWNGSVDTSFVGSGTAGNPYVISSAAELAGLAQLVNNNSNWSNNKHFVLTADIDLNNREWTPIGIQYTTSGVTYTDRWFNGVFDGNGHVVKNLKIGTASNRTKIKHAGLFGILNSSARIYNLGIETANIYTQHLHADDRRGAMVGLVEGGWVFGCYVRNVTVNDSGTCVIGGFVGQNSGVVAYSYAYNVNLSVGGGRKGGFVGDNVKRSTVSHSFVNYYPFVADNDGSCDVCYGETTVQGNYSTYGSFAFCSSTLNGGWPQLKWQNAGGLPFSNGSYCISTAAQLVLFSNLASLNGYIGRNIKLEDNINLSGYSWQPIGLFGGIANWEDPYSQFKGTFNGSGHVISNMTVNSNIQYCGLFASIQSPGSIVNLGMENCRITQNYKDARAGIIVARFGENTTLSQCYVKESTINVTSVGVAGVITAEVCSGSKLSDCYTVNSSASATRAGTVVGDVGGNVQRVYCYGSSSTSNSLTAQGSASNSHYNQSATVVNAAKGTYNAANAWVDDDYKINNSYIILKWQRDNLKFTVNLYDGSTKKGTLTPIYASNVTLPNYAKTGYIHNGYAYTNGGSKLYNAGTSYAMSNIASSALANGRLSTASNGSKTILNLYTLYTPITYTVAYRGHGATGGSTASSSHTYDQAKALTSNGFVRT
ncbi:MAG: hypothetical protein SOX69_01700, partial [Oscillospiraceae bacterium]|nr:hypothetical protein [Oscillospiraceae bacterium]